MTTQKSPDVTDRMGVYKRFAEVPAHDRFATSATAYDGEDVWATFVATRADEFDSTRYHATFRKTEGTWKAHMADRGRHHALATPEDVETWCATLAETRTIATVYTEYWVRLEEFYSWLQWHTDHPHVYHPLYMAAATEETAGAVWAEKVKRWHGRGCADD